MEIRKWLATEWHQAAIGLEWIRSERIREDE